ncbi:hypothetical protein [Allomuricauda sp. M10]|uniref:hypothetical protein n=1 Tax=Allomuricauda sp. M10 TaxID=2683292 RepID=UPI001D183475|nr:hypothetical protein [Muricauda sp. M10]
MNKLLLILVLLPLFASGQSKLDGAIQMKTEYGSTNQEIQDILSFEGIDYYHVQFIGEALKGKHVSIIAKKLWDGEITEIDTIVNTAKITGMPPISSDTLKFKITGKKFTQDQLKVFFRFERFGNNRMYEAMDTFDYSLRDIGTQIDIEIGKPFPAFAYILPYEKDGWKMWCAVDSSGKDVESWGKEFGLKHYLIFEMLFE